MSAVQLRPAHLYRCSFAAPPQRRRKAPGLAVPRCGSRSRLQFVSGRLCCRFAAPIRARPIRANLAEPLAPTAEADVPAVGPGIEKDVLFRQTYPLKRTKAVEGKVTVKLDRKKKDGGKGSLTIRCDLEGKWVLHWGVTYCDDIGSEWDQPPAEMRPPGSIPVKDYAVETPMNKSSSTQKGQMLYEVKINLDCRFPIAAVHFVLKEEDTGSWFHHRGRDFRVPLVDDVILHKQKTFSLWTGAFTKIFNFLHKSEGPQPDKSAPENAIGVRDFKQENKVISDFFEEYFLLKEVPIQNFLTVTVKRSREVGKNHLHIDTDIPGDVIIHWGVCRDDSKKWEIPTPPHPPKSRIFRKRALQTLLQQKANGLGNWGLFSVDKDISGVLFVLKLNEYTWLNDMGGDFYIPLISESIVCPQTSATTEMQDAESKMANVGEDGDCLSPMSKSDLGVEATDDIVSEIRSLVTDISAEKSMSTKTKEAQEYILQEIEKLAAEAYSIFRSSSPIFVEEPLADTELLKPPVPVTLGTGTGYEILCQAFNWESHKSGRWYCDLAAKASELANLGFTAIWLPPPTESVSPEGYMPRDLYNLNSRYGSMEDLKNLVNTLHSVGLKVLGDVVLNHRCAHYKSSNGVWNIFGGRLNWDDRAVVADDPHFQGRGNTSSGDFFHAAPNIDHSQEFVRRDIKEWLCWLREEVGNDGWRLDFARGFWGGYVKDYLEASMPYFSVGEYWDSLSYTYGEMDHNQDAHRQRIIDWINATNGTSGAFDVTTKGILHAALEKCEYWRLSDEKGKPPGVMGWWPSRAVTFIENHDTGSTQGHWRFPAGKEMQGYTYILTHPGTPTVFYDHIFSHHHEEIANLISIRNSQKIHCRSTIRITKAERDVYAAVIDEKVAMKIGPGFYEPPAGRNWSVAAEGRNYKVWEYLESRFAHY